jgi:two-component system chemotaxis response regulator CheY
MLVEDEPKVGQLIAGLLKKWHLDVTLVDDGEAAWSALAQQAMDLLIVDWKVPSLSGTELVQRLRQDPRLQSLPVLMISGHAGKEDIVSAIQTGINGYLAKPFTPEALKKKIAGILQAHKKETTPKAGEPSVANGAEDQGLNPAHEIAQIRQGHLAGAAAAGPLDCIKRKSRVDR